MTAAGAPPPAGGTPSTARRLRRAVIRAVRLRCPRCGVGNLFASFVKMHESCPSCALRFEREHGFFVGAIYVNYACTVLVALSSAFALEIFTPMPLGWRVGLAAGAAALFPLFFYRYSKSLWLGLDWFVNPDAPPPLRRVR
jgi:uncharacterized protein (DUF983 family)